MESIDITDKKSAHKTKKSTKIICIVALLIIMAVVLVLFVLRQSGRNLSGKKVNFEIDGKSYVVELYDNPTADDLYAKLSLTLTINDYDGWDEKIVRLEEPLSMEGAPAGDCPKIPEIGYYEPGNWIAVYYGFIGWWSGKVPLGRIDASTDELESIANGSTINMLVSLFGKLWKGHIS